MLDLVLQQIANGLVTGIAYSLLAVGVTMILRILGTINFAHGDLFVLSGLLLWVLSAQIGLPYGVSFVLAVAAAGAIGYVILRLINGLLNRDAHSALLATFGIGLILINATTISLNGRSQAVEPLLQGTTIIGPVAITNQRLLVVATGLLALLGVSVWHARSKSGKRVRAIAENRVGAQIIGVDVKGLSTAVFVGASLLAGLAGALMAPVMLVTATAGLSLLLKGIVVAILGSIGSIRGAIVGGLSMGILESVGSVSIGYEWADMIGYVGLIVLLLAHPQRLLTGTK